MTHPSSSTHPPSGTSVKPDGLHAAAQEMRSAADEDGKARESARQAEVEQSAFGAGDAAEKVATEWQRAVDARVVDLSRLATETNRNAEGLDKSADRYRAADHDGARGFARIRDGDHG